MSALAAFARAFRRLLSAHGEPMQHQGSTYTVVVDQGIAAAGVFDMVQAPRESAEVELLASEALAIRESDTVTLRGAVYTVGPPGGDGIVTTLPLRRQS